MNTRFFNCDELFFENYAKQVAKAKGISLIASPTAVTIRQSLTRVYRAVAFDLDGTLLDPGSEDIPDDVCKQIAQLLYRGVPVFIVSGRTASSLTSVCRKICISSKMSYWYVRRLQAIGLNGAFRLYTRTSRPEAFLECRENYVTDQETACIAEIEKIISQDAVRLKVDRVWNKKSGIRLTVKDGFALQELRMLVAQTASDIAIYESNYDGGAVYDITKCSKGKALAEVAHALGIPQETILRIGDNGHESGNDFDLLNESSGFSVDRLSQCGDKCLPVVSLEQGRLKGSRATRYLLERILIFPPLSLQVGDYKSRLRELSGFEKLAHRRAKDEDHYVTALLQAKYRACIPTGERFVSSRALSIGDVIDPFSGAVRLREWEVEEVWMTYNQLAKAFGFTDFHTSIGQMGADWHLVTDTGVLLRGPLYYFSLAYESDRGIIGLIQFLKKHVQFFRAASEALNELNPEEIRLSGMKLLWGLLDNMRNVMLVLAYGHFLVEENNLRRPSVSLSKGIDDCLVDVLSIFMSSLLDSDLGMGRALDRTHNALENMDRLLGRAIAFFERITDKDVEVMKYRECDNFLQNITAVQSALRDFDRHALFAKRKLVVVGLASGGIELPFLAKVIGKGVELDVVPCVARVSLYGRSGLDRAAVYRADAAYVSQLARSMFFRKMGDVGSLPFVIADDNCTTCVTLQLARDVFVSIGYDVVGAVVIRYPGTNRVAHMNLENHGFPDPENLIGFVRGLVAPSPYSRFSLRNNADKYGDALGIFDKSKTRLKNLLVKNQARS